MEFHDTENHKSSIIHEDLSILTEEVGYQNSVRNIWHGSNEDQCIDVGLFVSSSMKAAIHLGLNYTEKLEAHKNTNFEQNQNLFNITKTKYSQVPGDRMHTTLTLTSEHQHCSLFLSIFSMSTDSHRSVAQYTVKSPCTQIWIGTGLESGHLIGEFSERGAVMLSSCVHPQLVGLALVMVDLHLEPLKKFQKKLEPSERARITRENILRQFAETFVGD